MSYLMLTFFPHLGIAFSEKKNNMFFLLIISECFMFISEPRCLWSLGNKGIQIVPMPGLIVVEIHYFTPLKMNKQLNQFEVLHNLWFLQAS